MAKKKYYAVKAGKKIGIFDNWSECSEQVKGYSGAEYKSFISLQEAEAYLSGNEELNEKKVDETFSFDGLVAYVDGSYSEKIDTYAFGLVLCEPNGNVLKFSGRATNPNYTTSRNVAGELSATLHALNFAFNNGYAQITIVYDYEGIEKWTTGEWKANADIAKEYVSRVKEYKQHINIIFHKVKGHSGCKYNELADQLAKSALTEEKRISEGEKHFTFTNVTLEELRIIFSLLDEEYQELKIDESKNTGIVSFKLAHNKDSVRIIHYINHEKTIVQGNKTKLVLDFIELITELTDDVINIVEHFNRYYEVQIPKEQIDRQLAVEIPNLPSDMPIKRICLLKQAIYNLNLGGNFYDFESLVHPAFKLLDGYLKDTFELNGIEVTRKGYIFFEKRDSAHSFQLLQMYAEKIKSQQVISFLNRLYTFYNKHRNGIFHAETVIDRSTDMTRMIERKIDADNLNKEALKFVKEFYELYPKGR